ncbi:MAG: hypothetical protein DRJ42_14450 [Deltaproteobacteria bacterium]|nr:MAG: hypothetical protein DRJ42_14450 [Deltaproteobacteria bacterium]
MNRIPYAAAALVALSLSAPPALAQDAAHESEGPTEPGADVTDSPEAGGEDAQPGDAEARGLFEAGQVAFEDGRFEEAFDRFLRSYELSGRGVLLYNLATCLDRLGRYGEAKEYYERYLTDTEGAPNRSYVERRLEILSEHETGEAIEESAPPEDQAVPQPEGSDVSTSAAPEGGTPIGPIVLFSVAGASLIGAVTTALLANAKYGDLEASCPGGICDETARSDYDTLGTLTLTADVLFAVSAASAIGGLLWWLLTGDDEAPPATAGCGAAGCRLEVQASF